MFEIVPEKPYTEADLKWTNPLARCNREKIGKKDVPVTGSIEEWESYDTIYLGFPIWYYGAPNVIQSFCKGYDWSGKTIHVFATSGGSGIGDSGKNMEALGKGSKVLAGKRLSAGASENELKAWVSEIL